MKCGRCKVACYCNRECQARHWKSSCSNVAATGYMHSHKEICKMWCANRGSGRGDDLRIASVPVCLASCGYIDDELLMNMMRERGDAFLDEVQRCADIGEARDYGLNFEAAVICSVGGIRLGVAAHLYSNSRKAVVTVNHVLFETLEDLDEITVERAERRLYPAGGRGGAGDISPQAKARVVSKLTQFVGRLADRGLHANSFTYGRGLVNWLSNVDDAAIKNAKKAIEERNGQVNGVHRRIIWMCSSDYMF